MKLEQNPAEITVRVSKRNLLAFLTKLDWPESARTIQRQEEIGGPILTLIAESDEEHYAERPPGEMHPQTEEAIANFDSDGFKEETDLYGQLNE